MDAGIVPFDDLDDDYGVYFHTSEEYDRNSSQVGFEDQNGASLLTASFVDPFSQEGTRLSTETSAVAPFAVASDSLASSNVQLPLHEEVLEYRALVRALVATWKQEHTDTAARIFLLNRMAMMNEFTWPKHPAASSFTDCNLRDFDAQGDMPLLLLPQLKQQVDEVMTDILPPASLIDTSLNESIIDALVQEEREVSDALEAPVYLSQSYPLFVTLQRLLPEKGISLRRAVALRSANLLELLLDDTHKFTRKSRQIATTKRYQTAKATQSTVMKVAKRRLGVHGLSQRILQRAQLRLNVIFGEEEPGDAAEHVKETECADSVSNEEAPVKKSILFKYLSEAAISS